MYGSDNEEDEEEEEVPVEADNEGEEIKYPSRYVKLIRGKP